MAKKLPKKKLQKGDEISKIKPKSITSMPTLLVKPTPGPFGDLVTIPDLQYRMKVSGMTPKQRAKYDKGIAQEQIDALSGMGVIPNPLRSLPVISTDNQQRKLDRFQTGQEEMLRQGEVNSSTPASITTAQELSDIADIDYTTKAKSRFRNQFENIKPHDMIQFGLYGTDAFLRKNEAIKNQEAFNQRFRNVLTQAPVYDYNYMYGPDASGGTQYQNLIMAQDGAEIRKGTSPYSPLAEVEVEGGEVVQTPDGAVEHIEGPSHAKGGVHTNLPEGSRVFSDFLKPTGSKKTYAQLAKKYDTEKYRKVLDNPYATDIDRKTAQLMYDRYESVLNELFEDQQIQNGNSDGTDQAQEAQQEMMGKFGLDLKKGEKLSFTDPFEYGGEYLGGTANFQDGGMFPWDSTFYVNPKGDTYNSNGFYNVKGTPTFQDGGTVATPAAPVQEAPIDTVKELIKRIQDNPALGRALLDEYSKNFKDTADLNTLLNSLLDVTQNIQDIRAKATEEELKAANLDQTKDAYKNLAKKYGVAPITDETKIKRFQEVYRNLAKLQERPELKDLLADYELTPIGVDDTKWQGSLYSGKGISAADGWFGNTTIGQLLRRKALAATTPPPATDEGDTETDTKTPPVAQNTAGSVFRAVTPDKETMSTMGKFPLYQAAPNALGYLSGLTPANYFVPDFKPVYVAPPTLNIDDELQSIDDSFQSAIRQTTGNASIDNARNTALFNTTLQAKQQSFAKKQNFDANARWSADVKNADSAAEANAKNMLSAAQIYNEYQIPSQDLAETERLNSIFNLTDKVGKYYQDEYAKILAFDTLIPNYYYNGLDPRNPIRLDPEARRYFEKTTLPVSPIADTETNTTKPKKTKTT